MIAYWPFVRSRRASPINAASPIPESSTEEGSGTLGGSGESTNVSEEIPPTSSPACQVISVMPVLGNAVVPAAQLVSQMKLSPTLSLAVNNVTPSQAKDTSETGDVKSIVPVKPNSEFPSVSPVPPRKL